MVLTAIGCGDSIPDQPDARLSEEGCRRYATAWINGVRDGTATFAGLDHRSTLGRITKTTTYPTRQAFIDEGRTLGLLTASSWRTSGEDVRYLVEYRYDEAGVPQSFFQTTFDINNVETTVTITTRDDLNRPLSATVVSDYLDIAGNDVIGGCSERMRTYTYDDLNAHMSEATTAGVDLEEGVPCGELRRTTYAAGGNPALGVTYTLPNDELTILETELVCP